MGAWVYERFRGLVARQLRVNVSDVVLGGTSGPASDLDPPSFHIFGPSLAWRLMVNPHTDIRIYHKSDVGGVACTRGLLRSFSLTITMPMDSGLFYWDTEGRHKVEKTPGGLLTWPGDVPHSLSHWRQEPPAWRITLQAFTVKCGGTWYVYH